MKCTDCRHFNRSIIDGTQWCEAGIHSRRIQRGDEIKDLPCRKFKRTQSRMLLLVKSLMIAEQ